MSAPHYTLATPGGSYVAQRRGQPVLAARDDAETLILRFKTKEAAERARDHWRKHFSAALAPEVRR